MLGVQRLAYSPSGIIAISPQQILNTGIHKMKGTIILWHQPRAYGFVQADGSSDTFFIHVTNFPAGQVPRLGARVEFEVGDPISLGKKPQAINATILSVP